MLHLLPYLWVAALIPWIADSYTIPSSNNANNGNPSEESSSGIQQLFGFLPGAPPPQSPYGLPQGPQNPGMPYGPPQGPQIPGLQPYGSPQGLQMPYGSPQGAPGMIQVPPPSPTTPLQPYFSYPGSENDYLQPYQGPPLCHIYGAYRFGVAPCGPPVG